MINHIGGPPGNGKSAVSFMLGIDHLKAGGVLACNFTLAEDWALSLANLRLPCRLGFVDPLKQARAYWDRFFFETPKALESISLDYGTEGNPLSSLVKGRVRRNTRDLPEGRGLAIVDEAGIFMNPRNWEKNFPWIEFFINHRKLGWDVLLIAHDIEMVDKQIRPLVEYNTKLRNLKRVKLPLIPVNIPFNLFQVVIRCSGMMENSKASVHSRKLVPLFKPYANLYKTMKLFKKDDVKDASSCSYSHQGNAPMTASAAPPAKSAASASADDFFAARKAALKESGSLDMQL